MNISTTIVSKCNPTIPAEPAAAPKPSDCKFKGF